MAIYHCSIKIINRSGGRSAIASAAYRSGKKLHNEETGLTHDFTKKGGVIMNEIILPVNAPKEYLNREILWNEVQNIEKRSDAQFAREVEVALPKEMSREEQIECVREYINENFINKGMIADWALHDKGDGNPHAHIMLTVREVDVEGHWMSKQKSVFANARDEEGRPVFNPDIPFYNPQNKESTEQYRIPKLDGDGKQKVRVRKGKGTELLWEKVSIPSNDWNDRKNAEEWRQSWANHCNKYLDKDNQIDHRSYERQGKDIMPSIHEGVTARKMEAEGKIAERCQINRNIKELNLIKVQLKEVAKEITKLITEKSRVIYDRFRKFRRSIRNNELSRRDVGHVGKFADTSGKSNGREIADRGRERRIDEIKRTVDNATCEARQTDREIEATDNRIDELKGIIKRKEEERNDRFNKLKERRRSYGDVGANAGSDRSSGAEIGRGEIEEFRRQKDDIEALISNLRNEERASEEKRDNQILERQDRETEYQRSRVEKERAVRDSNEKSRAEIDIDKKRSR